MRESTEKAPEASTSLIVGSVNGSVNNTLLAPRAVPPSSIKLIDPTRVKVPRKAKSKGDEDFPLWFHGSSGRWCRTIRKQRHYFGTDKEAALDEWLRVKDYLLNGRTPPAKDAPANGPTIKLICDSFLTRKEQKRDAGEIRPRRFDELYKTCLRLTAAFGRDRLVSDLLPQDFAELRKELAKRYGAVALSKEIQDVRSVFKFAYEDGILSVPVRTGTAFAKPSAKVVRLERAKKGAQDLTAAQICALINAAKVPLKAMILLGINAGFGNADCGTLPLAAVDLEGGWISYFRPKNGIARRARLWTETIEALRAAIADRPEARDKADDDLVFLTKFGVSWAKGAAGNDPVGGEFKKLLTAADFHREGIGFYSLRRAFRTVADGLHDVHAVQLVMGHGAEAGDMGARYSQRTDDSRLEAVAAHVRAWLFAKPKAK